MKQFKSWAEKEYSLPHRILALIPAGALFVFLIPYLLAGVAPALDIKLGLPSLQFRTADFDHWRPAERSWLVLRLMVHLRPALSGPGNPNSSDGNPETVD